MFCLRISHLKLCQKTNRYGKRYFNIVLSLNFNKETVIQSAKLRQNHFTVSNAKLLRNVEYVTVSNKIYPLDKQTRTSSNAVHELHEQHGKQAKPAISI